MSESKLALGRSDGREGPDWAVAARGDHVLTSGR